MAVLDWLDAVHRGYGFSSIASINGDGVNALYGVQLFNPTSKTGSGVTSPVTALVKAIHMWSLVAAFGSVGFARTKLTTNLQTGINLLGEDFPTTGNGLSRCVCASQANPPAIGSFFFQTFLAANTVVTIPWEWICRLAPDDAVNANSNRSVEVQFSASGGVPIAGQFMGATFTWIELPSGIL